MNSQETPSDSYDPLDSPESRIRALEAQVAILEQALKDQNGELPVQQSLSTTIWKALALLIMLMLAVVPIWFVFRDRWLFMPTRISSIESAWNSNPIIRETTLPSYFFPISLCLLVLIIWFVYHETNIHTIFLTHNITFLPVVPNINKQYKYSRLFFYLFGIGLFGSILLGILTGRVYGWGYLIAITSYVLGWLLRELSVEHILKQIWTNRGWLTAFILMQLALIFLMRSLADNKRIEWGFLILFILSVANLFRYFRQIPTILWIFSLAVIFYLYRVNSWAFSVIGDDFAFFNYALEITESHDFWTIGSRLFDGQAVYGAHPYFSSLIQAASMALLGKDSFGWRFSGLYLSALAIIFFYLFYKTYLNRNVALIASVLLAASAYIMTFGKIGYNNLQVLLAMSLVFAASSWAAQSKLKIAYIFVGISLGFCFYVYPAGLYVIPLCGLLLLIFNFPKSLVDLKLWGWAGLSMVICVIPLLFQPGYWVGKLPGLVSNNPEIAGASYSLVTHFISNLIASFFTFLYIPQESHFVVVAYLDVISSLFYMFGLAFVIKWTPKNKFAAFLLAGLGLLFLLVGASHDRRFPPTTRMFILLPLFTVLTAIGIFWFAEQVISLKIPGLTRKIILVVVIAMVIGANLYQAYGLSPKRSSGQQSMEVLYVRLLQRIQDFETRSEYPKTILFLTDNSWGIDGYYLIDRVYNVPSWQVNLRRASLGEPRLTSDLLDLIRQRNTMVIIQPGLVQEWKNSLSTEISQLGKMPCEIKEFTNKDVRFIVWLSPELASLCDLTGVQ